MTANAGCGGRYDLLELLAQIEARPRSELSATHRSRRPCLVTYATPRPTSRWRRERLGYQVIVPFDEGVRRTAAWYAAVQPRTANCLPKNLISWLNDRDPYGPISYSIRLTLVISALDVGGGGAGHGHAGQCLGLGPARARTIVPNWTGTLAPSFFRA